MADVRFSRPLRDSEGSGSDKFYGEGQSHAVISRLIPKGEMLAEMRHCAEPQLAGTVGCTFRIHHMYTRESGIVFNNEVAASLVGGAILLTAGVTMLNFALRYDGEHQL